MKRVLLFTLCAVFFINSICAAAFEGDGDSFAEQAAAAVMQKLEIPENYTEFNSKVVLEQEDTYALLSWQGNADGSLEGGQIDVTVDSRLRVVGFNQYIYGDYTGDYKLAGIDYAQAAEIAAEFIARLCPEFYPQVRRVERENYTSRNFETYDVLFIRYEGDLPYYGNYITVHVNAHNARVADVSVVWTDFERIPSAQSLISGQRASQLLYERFGVIKEYAMDADGALYLRYASFADGQHFINAYTGNTLDTGITPADGTGYRHAALASKKRQMDYADEAGPTVYTTAEAETHVRRCAALGIAGGDVLQSTEFLTDSYGVYAALTFVTDAGEVRYAVVDLNTLEIRLFYKFAGAGGQYFNLSEEACRSVADRFGAVYISGLYESCGLLNSGVARDSYGQEVYYYNYARLIHGLPYDDEGFVIGVSKATGQVVSVQSGWSVLEYIPDAQSAILPDIAFRILTDEVDIELQYVACRNSALQMELRPVYALNPTAVLYVDAVTGALLNADGSRYVRRQEPEGTGAVHVAQEQIETLRDCGIFDGDELLLPDEPVRLQDYWVWVCRTIDCSDYRSFDEVGERLIAGGWITRLEAEENGPVTHEEAIRYLIGYMGFDELAQLEDTYQTGFVDEGQIDPALIGYAAIAQGFRIIQGNAFLPKQYLTGGVAAQILYNLITN